MATCEAEEWGRGTRASSAGVRANLGMPWKPAPSIVVQGVRLISEEGRRS